MILTEEEKKIVLQHREHLNALKEKKEKQKNCKHSWYYAGHSHNDDAYECSLCHLIKYE